MENYWVTIPAGEFLIGNSQAGIQYAQSLCSNCDFSNEQPQHSVFLDAYQIGKYEITNRQYTQCVKAGSCSGKSSFAEGRDLYPVVNVTWYDANTYCEWVGGRLPTEAEWEKAASWNDETKTKSIYPWGDSIDCSFANYYGSSCAGDTTLVGTYESGKSHYGLYDMAGNVWEWVNDWYDENYYRNSPSSNPMGPESGQSKVLRGGSWFNSASNIRSAFRYWRSPTDSIGDFGFRCSRSP